MYITEVLAVERSE